LLLDKFFSKTFKPNSAKAEKIQKFFSKTFKPNSAKAEKF